MSDEFNGPHIGEGFSLKDPIDDKKEYTCKIIDKTFSYKHARFFFLMEVKDCEEYRSGTIHINIKDNYISDVAIFDTIRINLQITMLRMRYKKLANLSIEESDDVNVFDIN